MRASGTGPQKRGVSWSDSEGGSTTMDPITSTPLHEDQPIAVRLSVDGVQFCLSPSDPSFGLSVKEYRNELRVQLDQFTGFLCITKKVAALKPQESWKHQGRKGPGGSGELQSARNLKESEPDEKEGEPARIHDELNQNKYMETSTSERVVSNQEGGAEDSKNSAPEPGQDVAKSCEDGVVSPSASKEIPTDTQRQAPETAPGGSSAVNTDVPSKRFSWDQDERKRHYIERNPYSEISFLSDDISKDERSTRKMNMLQSTNGSSRKITKKGPIRGMKARFSGGLPVGNTDAEFTIESDSENSTTDEFSTSELIYDSGTPLHNLCAQQHVTFDQLSAVLDIDPSAASSVNAAGQLPLHILSENVDLLQRKKGREIAHDFALELMEVYPEGILIKDEQDHMPFTGLIDQWVNSAYRNVSKSIKTLSPPVALPKIFFSESDVVPSNKAGVYESFPFVELSPVAEWSFAMLSASLNLIKTKQHQAKRRSARIYSSREGLVTRTYREEREEILSLRADLTENVASIPLLLKTILLIDDDEVRNRVLHLPIVRRTLLCDISVGPWLCYMLAQKGEISTRGVDYLVGVSDVTPQEFIGRDRSPRPECLVAYNRSRGEVMTALENLKGLIPSLVVLSKDQMEIASSTEVIWKILNSALQQPFVIGIFVMDFSLNFAMILAFRFDVKIDANKVFDRLSEAQLNNSIKVMCCYFFVRGIMDSVALAKASRRALRSHVLNIWKIVDASAVVLSFIASFLEEHHEIPGLLSTAVCLLWLKTLGFLKSVNLPLATFILALLEIVKDMRWFLVILTVAIIMFADMLHISATRSDDGVACGTNETDQMAPEAFCGPSLLESYAKLYSVVVGDVQYDEFSYSTGAKVLFVLFTFVCVIILLSVLIAIVSDSHTESRKNSRKLFGRARLDFTVTHLSQEKMLRPSSRHFQNCVNNHGFTRWACQRVGRWMILCCYLFAGVVADVLLVVLIVDAPTSLPLGTAILGIAVMMVLFIMLTTGIVIIAHFAFSGWIMHGSHQLKFVELLKNAINNSVAFVTKFVCRNVFDTTDLRESDVSKLESEGVLLLESVAETKRSLSRSIKESERSIKKQIAEAIKIARADG